MEVDGVKETWEDTCRRVTYIVLAEAGDKITERQKDKVFKLLLNREFIPGGRYLYSTGREFHQVNNCCTFRAEDSREGWADLLHRSASALMTGAGIGIDYSSIRCEGEKIKRTGGLATGPIALMNMINECGRGIVQGGSRRSAIWAGLSWRHKDIFKFIHLKDRTDVQKQLKAEDWNFPLPMELTNLSVIFDTEFYDAYEDSHHVMHSKAVEVWQEAMTNAVQTGEPGWSFNYGKDNESLRNACCEVTSEDDSDKCNLGTIWLNKITDLDHMEYVVKWSTLFLLCGGMYSDVPTDKIKEVGTKNNRIGLGLSGISEWLLTRSMQYEVNEDLRRYLRMYKEASEYWSEKWAKLLGVAKPVATRAIAPAGTIGLLAESTTAIEPIPFKSYKRRYLVGRTWKTQVCVDSTVKRLLATGVLPENIWDSRDLGFKQRVKFQADVQDYVDMSISSTCNMPAYGTPANNQDNIQEKCDILYKYSKRLRGFTVYPDGAIAGQPYEPMPLEEALATGEVEYEENEHQCKGGVCSL
jgi:ribonucleoside-diphosphate reductase alpha chain